MNVPRDFGVELDALKTQLNDLKELVSQINGGSSKLLQTISNETTDRWTDPNRPKDEYGGIFYSGRYRRENLQIRCEPQEREIGSLLEIDGDKAAKVLAALGHKQRLDILKSVISEPLTGGELVDRLNMGTTGQLYHHMKALTGANLLVQEDRGGKYSLPDHRTFPLLLLLAAVTDLLDTSDYMEMTEARHHAGAYLGGAQGEYDPHLLLWAVVENSILEHQAGYCSEVEIFPHGEGSITVADNGRGIPVQVLPNTAKPQVQAVLTEISRLGAGASFVVPGCEKGISIAVVNALSSELSVEIRRQGKMFRQDYQHGIPKTDLNMVGVTRETGTSITFRPDRELFTTILDPTQLTERAAEISAAYPGLAVRVHTGEEPQ